MTQIPFLPSCKNLPGKVMLHNMRKPVLPRIFLFLFLYCVVFVALVSIQFSRRGGFTQRVGDFVVSGQLLPPGRMPVQDAGNGLYLASNEFFLDGNAHVFFGGIDFGLIRGNDGRSLFLIGEDGAKREMLPQRLIVFEDAAHFVFPEGTELIFNTRQTGGALEMRISGVFSEYTTGIDLPFSPQRRASIRNVGNGQFIVRADRVNYSFGRSPMDIDRRVLLVRAGGGAISYRAIPEQRTYSPEDFIIPQAQSAQVFSEELVRWRDQNFSLWNRTISGQNNEDVVVAFITEAFARGTYRAAVSAVPQSFLRGAARTYESTVYFGNLNQTYLALIASEREKLNRLSRQINEGNISFLAEPRVFNYLAARWHNNLIDAGANLVRNTDPSAITLDIVPGILEGFVDWRNIRPGTENPFARFVDEASFLVVDSLRMADQARDRVFVFHGNGFDAEFNLRLGMALLAYADAVHDSILAGIGRSLILSVLSQGDTTGAVLDFDGSALPGLTTARLHRILSPLDVYPRAVRINVPGNNIWTWTAAQIGTSTLQNDVLTIPVYFPAGETHFMIVRGIRPFSRIQLYNIDFRSDPQFEIFDSSGWRYFPQEQTLILKKRHRAAVENIRIIFREPPAPVAAAPVPAQPAGGDAGVEALE